MNVCRLCLSEGVGYPSIFGVKSYVQKLVGQLQDVVGTILVSVVIKSPEISTIPIPCALPLPFS